MSATGTVKSFNGAKGFGFIDCGFGHDFFVKFHKQICVQPEPRLSQGGTGTDVFIHIKASAKLVRCPWPYDPTPGLRRRKPASSRRRADASCLQTFSD